MIPEFQATKPNILMNTYCSEMNFSIKTDINMFIVETIAHTKKISFFIYGTKKSIQYPFKWH